jgi:hypothetical protein
MNSFGFTLPVPEMRIPRYPKNAVILGWLGSQQVDRYGYHGPPGLNEEMAAASRRGRWPVVVPPDQVPVFEGTVRSSAGRPVPEGGCIGELRRRLTAGASADATANDEKVVPERGIEWYQSQANSLARSDSRFRAMVQAWSACMKRSGFRYKDTDQAAADRRWNAPGGDGSGEQVNISRTEIKTATTDLGCRNEVNYSGILQGLISAYEERIINEKSETLRSISSLLDVRLRNAAKILGEHPAS